ncbi:Cytochrome P450 [Mycena venus]|uniref:Cytochrome P450 n=1 Tax=Mycena venus TaxID=2733690 RepID=A0A8H7CIS5_9AGAR|nr:Cytochrome P450 [Mycena venus]
MKQPIVTGILCVMILCLWSGLTVYPVLALAVAIFVAVPLYRLSPFHPLHDFPGPLVHKITQLPMLYYALRGTGHIKIKALHDQYGRIVRTGPNTVSFLSASAIKQIYTSSSALDKTTAYDIRSMDGQGIFFFKDKVAHAPRRRLWIKSFSDHALSQYHDKLVLEVEHLIHCLLQRMAKNGQVDLAKVLPQYAYDNTNTIFFSGNAFSSLLDSDDPDKIVPGGTSMFEMTELFGHMEPLFHLVSCIPGISLSFERLSIAAAERRLKNGCTFQDGISYWFDGDDSQPKMNPGDLPIESGILLIGGADTTGGVLVLLLYFLITNSKWIALIRKELEMLKDGAPDLWLRSLDQLVILNAVIQESLRLGTPFPGFPRATPTGGIVIDGYYVPSGTAVNVPGWAYHLDEEHFPNSTVFDPNRWIEDGKFSPAKAALLAFSGGGFAPYFEFEISLILYRALWLFGPEAGLRPIQDTRRHASSGPRNYFSAALQPREILEWNKKSTCNNV